MGKTKIWSVLTLLIICVFTLLSCGGDDKSDTEVIDGVNVVNGKKLTSMTVDGFSYIYIPEGSSNTINVNYDAKGRLSNIIIYFSVVNKNKEIEYEVELARIDYDLRVLFFNNLKDSFKYMFSLNDSGFISQLDNCSFTYDSNGYLINVENKKHLWNIAYDSGDIIKSLTSNLVSGKMKIFYYFYGEDKTTGDLVFTIDDNEYNETKKTTYLGPFSPINYLVSFIAYQAGLFGKISKHCTYLSKSNETTSAYNITKNKSTLELRVKCKFE